MAIEFEAKKISSRELNPRQRRKLGRVVRWYRERNAYSGVTSVRYILADYYGTVWISIRTRRSDCGKYSPRAIVCEQYLHARLGPRGGLKVFDARSGISGSEKSHVQKFI